MPGYPAGYGLRATLAVAALTVPGGAGRAQDGPAPAAGDIVVTAQRREESAARVPISIATYSQDLMDRQGIRRIDDLARLTPALTFTVASGANANNASDIAIRGIASDVGSATTAIYIDDTPIQIRNVGYLGGNPYPRIFDLERVEILRGPQGTLFGAGAEGGAVRFLTPAPMFDGISLYGRGEIATTRNGAASREIGLALGAPLSSTLALRASGWVRRDGGYVDRAVQGTNDIVQKDINAQQSRVARIALAWRPVAALTLTPSFFYQRLAVRSQDQFWEGYGDAADSDFVTGVYALEPTRDRFILPALKIAYAGDRATIVANASYFRRRLDQSVSYTTYQSFRRSGDPLGSFANKSPDNSDALLSSRQTNGVQEVRAYGDGDRPIGWTVGVYRSVTNQAFRNFTESGHALGSPCCGGLPTLDGRFSYVEFVTARDRQLAGYANLDLRPADGVTLSAAARYTRTTFRFGNSVDGPIVGNVRQTVAARDREDNITPRFAAGWQVTPASLIYASAAKGFRPGGAQPQVNPFFCAADLALLGLTRSPTSYASDTLWSYELGTKHRLLGNRLKLDASIYRLDWRNIQQSVNLPFCNLTFVGNLGRATGRGAELAVTATPFAGLQLGATLAYTRIRYDADQGVGPNRLVAGGQRFGGPKWSGALFAQLDRPVGRKISAYGRADYSFAGDKAPPDVAGNFGFDPDLRALPDTGFISLRGGVRIDRLDLSLFVDNLTDAREPLSRNHDGLGAPLFYAQTFRPRTIGVTGQVRY